LLDMIQCRLLYEKERKMAGEHKGLRR